MAYQGRLRSGQPNVSTREERHRADEVSEEGLTDSDDDTQDYVREEHGRFQSRHSPKDNYVKYRGEESPKNRQESPSIYPDLSDIKTRERNVVDIGFKKSLLTGSGSIINKNIKRVEPIHYGTNECKPASFCNWELWSLVAVVMVVMCGVSLSYYIGSEVKVEQDTTDDTKVDWEKVVTSFESQFEGLKTQGSSQARRTWSILRSSIRSVLTEEPVRPAVVVLVSQSKSATSVVKCFSEKIGTLVSNTFNHTHVRPKSMVVEGKQFQRDPSSKKKVFKMVDDHLKNYNVVIVRDVDKLHGEAAMSFHAFCDDSNAPYKQAVVILTVDCSSESSGCNSRDEWSEDAVEEFLTKAWGKELPQNKLYPLLSRITANIAPINVESKDSMSSLCSS